MKLIELIGRLTEYNPQAEVEVIAHNHSIPFSLCHGGGDGCTKQNCDTVSFYVDELNTNENQ